MPPSIAGLLREEAHALGFASAARLARDAPGVAAGDAGAYAAAYSAGAAAVVKALGPAAVAGAAAGRAR